MVRLWHLTAHRATRSRLQLPSILLALQADLMNHCPIFLAENGLVSGSISSDFVVPAKFGQVGESNNGVPQACDMLSRHGS